MLRYDDMLRDYDMLRYDMLRYDMQRYDMLRCVSQRACCCPSYLLRGPADCCTTVDLGDKRLKCVLKDFIDS
jgi:hypothetical protein